MKYLFILLLLGGTIYFTFRGGSGSASFPMVRMTEATPVRDVPRAERQKVILFTGTSWCGACRQLDQSVISKPAWKEFADREISFTVYDISSNPSATPENVARQMQRYNIRSFPTMVIVNDRFEKVDEMVGSGPPVENYKHWIRQHSGSSLAQR